MNEHRTDWQCPRGFAAGFNAKKCFCEGFLAGFKEFKPLKTLDLNRNSKKQMIANVF